MMDMDQMISTFKMSEEDLTEMVEHFSVYRMDPVPRGVSKEDLPVSVRSFGALLDDMGFSLTEAELLSLIYQLDPNNSGYIILSTFLTNGAKTLLDKSRITEETAKEVFNLMDHDRDKMVTMDDLKRTLKMFGEELPNYYIKEMLKEIDIDGDDMICYDEFLFFTTGIVE
nr:calmodulin-2/4 [Halyomorpha halys]